MKAGRAEKRKKQTKSDPSSHPARDDTKEKEKKNG
jgi:hypothetical protein